MKKIIYEVESILEGQDGTIVISNTEGWYTNKKKAFKDARITANDWDNGEYTAVLVNEWHYNGDIDNIIFADVSDYDYVECIKEYKIK